MHTHFYRGLKMFLCFIMIGQGCATNNSAPNGGALPAEQKSLATATPIPTRNADQELVLLDWDKYLTYDPSVEAPSLPINREIAAAEPKPASPAPLPQAAPTLPSVSAHEADIAAQPTPNAMEAVPPGVPPNAIVRIPGKLTPKNPSQETKTTEYLANQERLGEPNHAREDLNSRTPDVRSMPVGLEASPDLVDERGTYRVNIPQLNARSGPSMQADVVRTLDKGQIVKGTGREGIWIHTAENDYVSIIFLTKISSH